MNVCVADNFAKLLKVDFSVLILVGKQDGLVNNLLELCVFQVGPNHHLKHLEQLTVADVAIIVHVINSETQKNEFLMELWLLLLRLP